MVMLLILPPFTASCHLHQRRQYSIVRRPLGEPLLIGKRCMFTTYSRRSIRSFRILREFKGSPVLVPAFRLHCCVKELQLARFMSVGMRSDLSRTSKSPS